MTTPPWCMEHGILLLLFYKAYKGLPRIDDEKCHTQTHVLEMKCLRSLVGVSRMDRVWNEEVRRRAGIQRRELAVEQIRLY